MTPAYLPSTLLALVPITVRTPRDLDALAVHTYILAVVAAVVALAVAALVANSMAYEGGLHPLDPGKRRLSFWLILLAVIVIHPVYQLYGVGPHVAANLQSRLVEINAMSTGVVAVVYILLGFVLSRVFASGKIGNWFGARR